MRSRVKGEGAGAAEGAVSGMIDHTVGFLLRVNQFYNVVYDVRI